MRQVVPIEGEEADAGTRRLVDVLVDLRLRVVVPTDERLVAAHRGAQKQGREVVVLPM